MLPKVSVMLVTYNHREFIKESIESVLNQNYPNLEIVVADDASTDGTQEIIQEYVAKYPELFKIILAKNNEGVTVNCNRAFFACTGKYIAFFSGDDMMLPSKLHKQVLVLEQDDNLSMCAAGLEAFDSETNKTLWVDNGTVKGLYEYGFDDLLKAGMVQGGTVLARRSMCPEGGYDPRLPTSAEALFFMELNVKGKVKVVDEILYRYRIHNKNVTRTLRRAEELLKSLYLFEEKYPEFAGKTQTYHSLFRYVLGIEMFRNGNKEEAQKKFIESLNYSKKNWKSWLWLSVLLFPEKIQNWLWNVVYQDKKYGFIQETSVSEIVKN